MHCLSALCMRLNFFFFFLFTKSLKSRRSPASVLIPQKQEVGQQAEKVMLLSVMNGNDASVLVCGPLLRCPLAAHPSG